MTVVACSTLLLRAALTFVPSMWLWGSNTQRFLPPSLAWGLWGLWASSLHPAVGRRLSDAIASFGEVARTSRSARVGLALALGALALWLQDKTWFIGDFLIRRGAAGTATFAGNFQQSLPLEAFLYDRAPRLLSGLVLEPSMLHRVLGALSVFAVALASLSFARSIGRSGATALVGATALACGGYVLVATGLGKPAALLCVCVALVAACACGENAGWGEAAKVGAITGFAIFIHRSGLLLVPCWGVVLYEAIKKSGSGRPPVRQALAAALPLLALAMMGPRLLHIITSFDIPHHLAGQSLAGLDQRWSVHRAFIWSLDLANLLYVLVPALPLLAIVIGQANHGGRVDVKVRRLWALALPWLAVMVAVRPQQGLFRDVDVFAPGGMALAALVSALVVASLESPGLDPRLPAVIVLSVVVPTIQVLLVNHDPTRGLKRVAAYATEAPHREEADLARTWDFLTLRAFALGDWHGAAAATARAVSFSPSPRLLIMQGISSVYVGEYETAVEAYRRALSRDPDLAEAWLGLAGAAMYRGDRALADSAMVKVRSASRDRTTRSALRQMLIAYPAVMPSTGEPRPRR